MTTTRIGFRLLISLVILAVAFTSPDGALAAASPAPTASSPATAPGTCTTVDFYIYNATQDRVFVDITNWSNYTRWLDVLDPGGSTRFSLAPGSFEFWASSYDSDWDLSGGDVYTGCTQVAIYIKNVKGPAFKVRLGSG